MMNKKSISEKLIEARAHFAPKGGFELPLGEAAEGGCGVIGFAASEQVAAKHMLNALTQMRNRGNGKGGGIAAAGLVASEFGVSQEVLENDYMIAVAYLDSDVRKKLEAEFIEKPFIVDHVHEFERVEDWASIEGLDVRPPDVVAYFVRVNEETVAAFKAAHDTDGMDERTLLDEIVYQNTYQLNITYYQSTGEKQAFVLSHAKNLLVLKMVGFGDDVIRYYKIEEMHAHVWIGHHRFPKIGRAHV